MNSIIYKKRTEKKTLLFFMEIDDITFDFFSNEL